MKHNIILVLLSNYQHHNNGKDKNKNKNQESTTSALPIWALCKIHCGFADSVVKYELNKLYDQYGLLSTKSQNIINELQLKPWLNDNDKNEENKNNKSVRHNLVVSRLASNIEIAKQHYRLILKLDNKFVGAPLGLGCIFGKFEGKSKLSDKHYTEAIKLCKQKLLKLFEKYQIEVKKQNLDKKQQEIHRQKMIKHNIKLLQFHQNRIVQYSNLIDYDSDDNNQLINNNNNLNLNQTIEFEEINDNDKEDDDDQEEKEKEQEKDANNNVHNGVNEEEIDNNIEEIRSITSDSTTEAKVKKRFSDEFRISLGEIDQILLKYD